MFFGYNTNGFAHHNLFDAVELLADIGYHGVAITIDHNALPPHGPHARRGIERLRRLFEKRGIRSVIETGARYLLDPRIKHEPTLLSDDRRRRIDFYKYAIDLAWQLGSDCVSLWSGALHYRDKTRYDVAIQREAEQMISESSSAPCPALVLRTQAMDRLIAGLCEVLYYAAARKVVLAFEPEPDMLIDTMQAFDAMLGRIDKELADRFDAPKLHLTLDIGHLQCQGETPIAEVIRRWASRLANVHIEDMRRGIHEHLMFGEGEIAFPPVLHALRQVGYTGGVYVELSRHSDQAPMAARKAFEFLQRL